MSKKQAHILYSFFDLCCMVIIWIFCNSTIQLFSDIHNQAGMVTVSSKEGFFIFAIVAPIVHLISIVEYFYFKFIKSHAQAIGYGFIAMLIFMFVSAFVISSLLKAKVENAGYFNCRELEWSGTYSVSYTYTRNQEICGKLVAEKSKQK